MNRDNNNNYAQKYDIRITNLPVSYERDEQENAKQELKAVLLEFSRSVGNLLEPFDLLIPRGDAVGYLKMAAESIVPGVMHLLQGAELSVWGHNLQFNLVDQKHRSNQYNFPEWRACREIPEEQHKEKLLHAQFVARCWLGPKTTPASPVATTRPTSSHATELPSQLSTSATIETRSTPVDVNAFSIPRLQSNAKLTTTTKNLAAMAADVAKSTPTNSAHSSPAYTRKTRPKGSVLPKLPSATNSNVAGATRTKSKRGITQSSSLEPLDKQTRDEPGKIEPENSNKPALKSLREMVLAIQRQVNKLVDQLHVSEDDA